jgi:hypothetical protein
MKRKREIVSARHYRDGRLLAQWAAQGLNLGGDPSRVRDAGRSLLRGPAADLAALGYRFAGRRFVTQTDVMVALGFWPVEADE